MAIKNTQTLHSCCSKKWFQKNLSPVWETCSRLVYSAPLAALILCSPDIKSQKLLCCNKFNNLSLCNDDNPSNYNAYFGCNHLKCQLVASLTCLFIGNSWIPHSGSGCRNQMIYVSSLRKQRRLNQLIVFSCEV